MLSAKKMETAVRVQRSNTLGRSAVSAIFISPSGVSKVNSEAIVYRYLSNFQAQRIRLALEKSLVPPQIISLSSDSLSLSQYPCVLPTSLSLSLSFSRFLSLSTLLPVSLFLSLSLFFSLFHSFFHSFSRFISLCAYLFISRFLSRSE